VVPGILALLSPTSKTINSHVRDDCAPYSFAFRMVIEEAVTTNASRFSRLEASTHQIQIFNSPKLEILWPEWPEAVTPLPDTPYDRKRAWGPVLSPANDREAWNGWTSRSDGHS